MTERLCVWVLLLFVCTVTGQKCISFGGFDGSCGSPDECQAYLQLTKREGEDSLKIFFQTPLGQELGKYVGRCCSSVVPSVQKSIIPSEEECGFGEPKGAVNDIQRRGAFPWFVALGRSGLFGFSPICGGALISRRHVLTSAHCLQRSDDISPLHVRLGDYDLSQDGDASHVDLPILRFTDPGYSASTLTDDIAIITLNGEVEFNDFLRPVCLPFAYRTETFDDSLLVVIGYGRTSLDGSAATKPVAEVTPGVRLSTCQAKYNRLKTPIVLTDSQMCAGREDDAACVGDGGGPLHYYNITTKRFYVAGTVSLGVGTCGTTDFPGIYTRVGAYMDWITSVLLKDV